MKRSASLSVLTASLLLLTATLADGQPSSSPEPIYVDTGRDFRQADQVTMGANLLTPEEENRFAALRQQATTRAEMDRIEAELSVLLNQRVAERVNGALNRPITPDLQQPSKGVPGRSDQ